MDRSRADNQEAARALQTLYETDQRRREIVRAGIKPAFVAPVVTTFLARDAMAAGSNHGCYPAGHPCAGPPRNESCCAGLTCSGICTE